MKYYYTVVFFKKNKITLKEIPEKFVAEFLMENTLCTSQSDLDDILMRLEKIQYVPLLYDKGALYRTKNQLKLNIK